MYCLVHVSVVQPGTFESANARTEPEIKNTISLQDLWLFLEFCYIAGANLGVVRASQSEFAPLIAILQFGDAVCSHVLLRVLEMVDRSCDSLGVHALGVPVTYRICCVEGRAPSFPVKLP